MTLNKENAHNEAKSIHVGVVSRENLSKIIYNFHMHMPSPVWAINLSEEAQLPSYSAIARPGKTFSQADFGIHSNHIVKDKFSHHNSNDCLNNTLMKSLRYW